jgi:hypothetical protein
VRKSLAAGVAIAVLAAGCGGEKHAQSVQSTTAARTTERAPRTPLVLALIRDYRRLGADVRAMRAAALRVHKETLKGTPELRRTTGRFIVDLEKSHLSPKARNRMIDHAAGAVATSCDQCFQQLEAMRPIPQIAHP